MLREMRTSPHSKPPTIFAAVALLIALFSAACKSDSPSVVSGSDQTAQANVKANPTTSASPAPATTPATVPTTPVGPVGQTSPTSPGGAEEKRTMLGNLPVTVSPAKPPITPQPDPFPARPTPAVVMDQGKIVQQWQAPAEAAKLANPVKDKPDAAKLGREYYLQKCADCHGKTGQGNGWMSGNTKRDGTPLPPTNLASQMVQANSDGELFWKITNGRSPMPAHRVRFDDEQRWYIVAYLRSLKQ
jgi:mono/diheme cytochrome c family protein